MKTFIYTDKVTSVSRTYGGSNHLCKIYKVVNNRPEYLGETTYCTRATMGAISEVNVFLLNNKHIPKTWSMSSNTKSNYYSTYQQNKYRIYEV